VKAEEIQIDLAADPRSVPVARRFVAGTLRSWGCPHLVDKAALLVSEAVTNSVVHASSEVGVSIRRVGARVRIEIADEDPRLPVRRQSSPWSGSGRGILIVDSVADDWGIEANQEGKAVWFELDATAYPHSA